MLERKGFVANSSSCSYIIDYSKDCYLENAQEILNFIVAHPTEEIHILGPEWGEGFDFFTLTAQQKRLIVLFNRKWLKNGDRVKGFVGPCWPKAKNHGEEYLLSFVKDENSPKEVLEVEVDHSAIWDNGHYLEEFYAMYLFEGDLDFYDDFEVPRLSHAKHYAILYNERMPFSELEYITDPKEYPIIVCREETDETILRTVLELGDYNPMLALTYRDYIILESPKIGKPKPYKKDWNKFSIYTNAKLLEGIGEKILVPTPQKLEILVGDYNIVSPLLTGALKRIK